MAAAPLEEVTVRLEARLPGRSAGMRRLRERIACLAQLWTPVLVVGEPGSGRDSVVKALHELGVTTGEALHRLAGKALENRPASPQPAAIYLDGIEALPADAQVYWSGRLADAEGRSFALRPRVLASATHSFLADDAKDFDPRLFQTLRRFCIEIPPLRDRREDIPEIADAFVESRGRVVGRRVRLSAGARRRLSQWSWPGNVAQLEQLVERMVTFSPSPSIGRRVVDEVLADAQESVLRVRRRHAWKEREALVRAIHATGGNISHTAELLETSRSAVYRRIQKHGIELSRARSGRA